MAENKTDAWMPLWIGAYLADTQHLERDEHGAYFLLMMAYWRNQAPLADDDKRLASIAKCTPKEWKALRPTMAEFFKVADGVWWHKRIEAELAGSKARSAKAAIKAKAGAQARWGHTNNDAPSMLQALPEDMPRQCPTPSPSPIGIGIPTFVAKEVNELNTRDSACETQPGEVCMAMKAIGIGDVNPGNLDLAMLLQAGAELAEFQGAAASAVEKHKGFKYALGIVKHTRQEAAQSAPALHRGPLPKKANAATEPAWRTEQRNRTLQAVPSIAERNTPAQEFFDVEAKNVTSIALG
jgi:uncharacterized protein YdaU (DUF1376 family)